MRLGRYITQNLINNIGEANDYEDVKNEQSL